MSSEELGDKLQRINVLSIDGGGIRGIIPAMVLAEIESRTGKNACQLFDIITGTSTGGILALGLAKPMSTVSHEPAFTAAQLVDLYEKYGRAIFPQSIWRKIGTWFRAQYPVSGLEKLLEEYFGDSRLSDALTRVVVTSYDIENRKAFFFRSVRAQTAALQRDYDYPMKSVARATSAAPTYFEPGRISRDASAGYWALIDGGVFANNPAMCAYVEALEMNPNAEICVVSLGTGAVARSYPHTKVAKWGLLSWARPLIDVFLDGPSNTVHYQLDKLLSKWDYYRVQVDLETADDALDNATATNIAHLKSLTQRQIEAKDEYLQQLCSKLLANKFYSLSNSAIAAACGISSQKTAQLLQQMSLPPEMFQELLIGSKHEKRYAPEVLTLVRKAVADPS